MPTDPHRIQTVFLAATEIAGSAERAQYLDGECADDAELRARVEALLRAFEQPDSLLDQPAFSASVDEARTVRHDSSASVDDEISLGFLAPATRPDSLGRIGHYEVLQVLGQGGFGVVFRAFDDVLHRVVAVKVLSPQMAATSPARKRFLREARSSAAVKHENVVQVYEVGEQPLPYIAMEFVPGETLQQRLDRAGPVDVAEVLRIGRQIAEGLTAAHAADLIHRDIKPGNILLEGGTHKVKITDFGLARAADDASLSQSGLIAGTPMYMAPEQALGQTLDQRADLFSLGSVLYQMVAGRPPFRANSTLAVLKRVTEDDPRPIREIIPEAPQWLCDIISKLHAKQPNERFQSARELADVLADCEDQLKATGKVQTAFQRPITKPSTSRMRQSRLRKLALTAALVVLIFLGLWFGRTGLLTFSNQGELEILPEDGLISVIVLHNDEGVIDENKLHASVTDWMDMKKRQSLTLSPGRYQLNVGTYPQGTTVDQWEVTTSSLFGNTHRFVPVIQTSAIITVERGQRVTLRPKMRSTPPVSPIPPTPINRTTNAPSRRPQFRTGGDWRIEGSELVQTRPEKAMLFFGDENWTDYDFEVEANSNGVTKDGHGICLAFRATDTGNYHDLEVGGWSATVSEAVFFKNGNWGRSPGTFLKIPHEHNRWYKVKIEVRGPRISCSVDGNTLFTFRDETFLKGMIGLGTGNSPVRWRNLKVTAPDGTTLWEGFPILDAAQAVVVDPDRKAAEWVLSLGGVVKVNEQSKAITGTTELPREPFRLSSVELTFLEDDADKGLTIFKGCKNILQLSLFAKHVFNDSPVTDEGLANFKDCAKLTSLSVNSTGVTDVSLLHLKECRLLTSLSLSSSRITDAGMARIRALRNLSHLDLSNTKITDAGLAHFEGYPNLTHLVLAYTNVTDAGLVCFKDCNNLVELSVGDTLVSDKGVAAFAECKNLDILRLRKTQVGDVGLAHFRNCNRIQYVDLSGTKITDAGLIHLKSCPGVSDLNLGSTSVSDAGLVHLAGADQLTELDLRKTQVTARGVRGLTTSLPKCTIVWDGGVIEPRNGSDRRAAQWVLSIGGTVEIDRDSEIKALVRLPQRVFRLTRVDLGNNPEVSDTGMAAFKDCKYVIAVDLINTTVSDAALAHLDGCSELTKLLLVKTKVTAKGVEQLAKALPKCRIEWDGGVIGPK